MSDINITNDNLKETSFVLGASYNSQSYSSVTPDENALTIAESSTYTDIMVSKSGDSSTVENPNNGANAAVVITGSGNSAVITESSTIKSECNNSQAIYCTNYADITLNNSTITTTGNNNAAVVSSNYGNINIDDCSIKTNGDYSPAIYAGDHSGFINVKADINVISDYIMSSDYENYSINFQYANILGSSAIGSFNNSGEINIKNSTINAPLGFDFIAEDSEDRTNFIVYLIENNISVNNTLFNLYNTDFYISIKDNDEIILNNTIASVNNGSKGTIAIREQNITGEVRIDAESAVRVTVSDNSNFTGAIIKPEDATIEGNKIRMNLSRSSWTLTADTFLTELIVDDTSTIDLNDFVLTVNGVTSDYQVGYIVNYKSSDRNINQTNLVIIKINEDGTYNLYDTDDFVTYNNVSKSEMTFTARVLDDIDALLADIDERAKTSQTTETLEDGVTVVVNGTSDANGILIDSGVIEHTDITVIKSGDTMVEEPTVLNTVSNAAILVTGGAEFIYHSSTITTSANYSAGLVVTGENSKFTTTNIEVTTNQDNSMGILSADQGEFTGTGITVTTSGENSHGVYVDNASVSLTNSTIDAQGLASMGVLVRTTSDDVTLNGVTISSDDYAVYVTDSSSATIQNSTLNNGIFVNESGYVKIEQSKINTNEIPAYTINGSGEIDNGSNVIESTESYAVAIEDANFTTLTLANDTITNTGDYPSIYVRNSTVNITLDNTTFITEDLMLQVVDFSTVNLTISGDVAGDIVINDDCILNVTISGNYTGVINNTGISGEVNVTITNTGKWTLSAGRDSYIQSLTIEDSDNTRVIYIGTSRLFVGDESFVNRNDVPIDIDSGYSTKLYPTQRTLKICRSEDLPDRFDRDKNYMYLVYDKMELYIYQSRYSDPFCIVEVLPANKAEMTDKMVYITTDGYIYCYMNYKAYQLGTVENFDPDQLEILTKCGTTYFMNAESRYIDTQKRTIQLPFQNGNYQLNLSLFEDIMIDENTVIRFDPETEQFYVAGKEYQFDNRLNNVHAYSGGTTSTVKNRIDKHVFRSDVKIAGDRTNSIQVLKNGLYVSTIDLVKLEDYDRMITAFARYKKIIDIYIEDLKSIVGNATEDVSEESIRAKINEALTAYEPTIQNMFSQYDSLANRMDIAETSITTGFSNALEAAKDEIKEYISETNAAWHQVEEGDDPPTYNQEQIDTRILMINAMREQFVSLRESADPEEEHIGSTGDITDANYSLPGLSEDETSVQEYILDQLDGIFNSMDTWIVVTGFEDLPETGESEFRYFVVNPDHENRVYQEYKWIGDDTITYQLIYEYYFLPEEPEPEPEPEPDPEEP